MDTMRPCCAGLDVHYATVVACILKGPLESKPNIEIRGFSTVLSGLLALQDWLFQEGCTDVAMESTGVYWESIYSVLESTCDITLIKERHIKNLLGRKTDIIDAQWIAELHRSGLICKSYINPQGISELHDLVCYRKQPKGDETSERNRINKIYEAANVKLSTTSLFEPFQMKNLTLKNRIVMPPMCQYSVGAKDGKATDWHFAHYVSRAIGGTGLIIIEMTQIEPDGRITDLDLGLWVDEQIEPLRRVVDACHSYGSKVAIQIGHAGRKAEDTPFPVAPSPIAFSDRLKQPRELSNAEVKDMVNKFEAAIKRALQAGMDAIEIHGAHGYLIHQFQSPYTNQRTDGYGMEKTRFGVEIIKKARRVMPETMPLIMRISAMEYVDGGYDLDYSTELCRTYLKAGVDILHISAGGEGPVGFAGKPEAGPGYQVEFAKHIKEILQAPVIAVGRLEDYRLADQVIREGKADLVAIGRGMLRAPYWASEASVALRGEPLTPRAYEQAYRFSR